MKTKTQANEDITQSELMEILEYERETGIFRWKTSTSKKVKVGDVAGTESGRGYWYIKLRNRLFKAHRLAWLYEYGEWPKLVIDHINGNKKDNRIENLRDVSKSENQYNRKIAKNNTSGFTGISYMKSSGKWRVCLSVKKKQISLGSYDDVEYAKKIYQAAKEKYHKIG